jgi:drug/metabolite transporter (DMT)-like permease
MQRGWLPLAGLVLAMLIWASSFIAQKIAFTGLSPMAVVFSRMAVASLCFLPFLAGWRRNVRYAAGDWKWLLLMPLFEPCLYFIFEALALTKTSASQAGMLVSMLPLLVAVVASRLLGEKLSVRAMSGFILAIAGAVWLSLAGVADAAAPDPVLGNFLEFLAMVAATGYTILVKRLSPRYPPLFLTAVQAFVGTIFFLPVMLLHPTPLTLQVAPGSALPVLPIMAVLFLGVVVSVGAYGLYNYGLSRIPASRAAAFTNLIPVFTVVMGRFALGERFTDGQYLASVLVLAGVILSQTRSRG